MLAYTIIRVCMSTCCACINVEVCVCVSPDIKHMLRMHTPSGNMQSHLFLSTRLELAVKEITNVSNVFCIHGRIGYNSYRALYCHGNAR